MKLQDILNTKGSTVHSISPEASLQEVATTLIERRIGSLVVYRADTAGKNELVGIITERDILRACTVGSRPLAEVRVAEAMTTTLVTGAPDEELETVMGLMTTHRIRHLPVLSAGRLVGMISIGDVVKAQYDRLALENQFMKDYIGNQR